MVFVSPTELSVWCELCSTLSIQSRQHDGDSNVPLKGRCILESHDVVLFIFIVSTHGRKRHGVGIYRGRNVSVGSFDDVRDDSDKVSRAKLTGK